jgi:hypothetical protein
MPTIRPLVRGCAVCLVLAGCTISPKEDLGVTAVQANRAENGNLTRDLVSTTNPQPTLSYWKGLTPFLKVATGDELRREVPKCSQHADAICKLPVMGVDPELVEKALALARELKNAADIGLYLTEDGSAFLRPPSESARREFDQTFQLTVEAGDAVKAMRPVLSQRYQVEFPAPELSQPAAPTPTGPASRPAPTPARSSAPLPPWS